jgi:tetratricopeptide (TPR) repeat protein
MDESHIRKLATEGSFKRGMDYYHRGVIIEPMRQGAVLRAQCEGSGYEPYQVSAAVTEEGIEDIRCTCPYNHGGICKHAVALLLTFVHDPEAFRIVPPLVEMLAGHSREELIEIIGAMVEGQHDLLWRLEILAGGRRARPVDVDAYRRQVAHVLGHRSLEAVEWGLQPLTETADELAKAGDWLKAGALYCTLLVGAVEYYDDEAMAMDEEGDFAVLVGEFAEGLTRCLEEGRPGDDLRREWLEALLDAELRDIEMGGIDLAPEARVAVLAHATDGDWTWIEERVLEDIPAADGWRREELVSLLAERRTNAGRGEDAAALIRELGTPEQQAFLLVEEGRIDEAMPRILEIVLDSPGLVTAFADALAEVKAEDAAIGLVTGYDSRDGAAWLANYHREKGDWDTALEWQAKTFFQNPSVNAFETLREVADRIGRWEQTRTDVLEALEREKG